MICKLLGIDDDDHERFGRWADTIFSGLDADADAVLGRLEEITRAQRELDSYATGLVAERKGCPHADLVTDLVQASYEEDRLSVDELVAMIEAILLAGTDTTRNQLGSSSGFVHWTRAVSGCPQRQIFSARGRGRIVALHRRCSNYGTSGERRPHS